MKMSPIVVYVLIDRKAGRTHCCDRPFSKRLFPETHYRHLTGTFVPDKAKAKAVGKRGKK
jgi:hypothetical protein